jgi:hypothetical protein
MVFIGGHMSAEAEPKQGGLAVCDWIVDKLERHSGAAAALALFLIFVIALGQSGGKLLWYDELVTLKTASLPHWNDVWNFYDSGTDTTGPLQSFIARVGLMLPIDAELGSRLPFTFAYLVMCLCLYGYVRRRYPAGYALASLVFMLNFATFYYATEARAYALVLAGVGFAMFCWQSAVSGRHRLWSLIGLWLGLAFAIDAHAFAIFLFVPFALAQFVSDFKRKKSDWAIWAALVLFPAGILPVLHGELIAKKTFGGSFWAQPHLESMVDSYRIFCLRGRSYVIAVLLAGIGAALLQRHGRLHFPEPKARGFSVPEWVLAAMIALLPLYVIPASYLLHIYDPRYVISCNMGLVILAVAAVAEVARRGRIAGVALLALFLLGSAFSRVGTFVEGLHALAHPCHVHQQLQARFNNYPWMKLLEQSMLPVATDDPHQYGQIDYYAKPELNQRLYALTDIGETVKYPLSATSQLNFLRFGKQFSYRVLDVANFVPEHSHFLLAPEAPETANYGWLPHYLIAQQVAGNASFSCLGPACASSGANVFDVQFTKIPIQTEKEAISQSISAR